MAVVRLLLLLAGACAACAGAYVPLPPTITAPGNLTRDQVPMFVLFTHDDGVDAEARRAVLKVTKGRQAAGGCPLTATMFTLIDADGWTSCDEVVKLYEAGYEIAGHTTRHESLPGRDREFLEQELVGARRKLAECGIPEDDIVGFRAPFLNTDTLVREVLHDSGFLYDSTLIEDSRYSLSHGFANRIWPWDMAYGIPINCSIADLIADGTIQGCAMSEYWPGLWEVPVWRFSNDSGLSCDLPYAMDPGWSYECNCMNDTHTTYDLLKSEFDAAYSGNRAPFPIFIHIYWLQAADNTADLQQFVDYTLTFPDVYYVTLRQLLAWMQNPVPKDQLTPEILGCGNPGGAPGDVGAEEERRRLRRLRRQA